MRVLVVDNDHDAADCLAMLLKLARCDVRVAYDGIACLDEATKFVPDLLLADLGMPRMDGNELARQIRQCRSLDRIMLVALTGYADPQTREVALAAGFAEYLVKPVPAETLYELMGRVAASSSLAAECHYQADLGGALAARSFNRHWPDLGQRG